MTTLATTPRRTVAPEHETLMGQRFILNGNECRVIDTTISPEGTVYVGLLPTAAHVQLDGDWYALSSLTTPTLPAAHSADYDSPLPDVSPVAPCPLGCGRQVAAQEDAIHCCIFKAKDGRKTITQIEYVGTWDGRAICFEPTYHDAELVMRDYRAGLFADGLLDMTAVVYARPAEELAFTYVDTTALLRQRRHEAALLACPCTADPLAAALADDPNATIAHAEAQTASQHHCHICGRWATQLVNGKWLCDGPHASLTRAPEHDLRRPIHTLDADAWLCGVCHEVFWAAAPLTCPRCEHQAQNPPVAPQAPRCPCCDGAHALARCKEFAQEWRRQEEEDRRAGAAVAAHIQRDYPGFLAGYASLTEEQRAGVMRSYRAYVKAEAGTTPQWEAQL